MVENLMFGHAIKRPYWHTIWEDIYLFLMDLLYLSGRGNHSTVESRKPECKIDAGVELIGQHISLVWWFHGFFGDLQWKRGQTTWTFNPAPQDVLSLNWKVMRIDGSPDGIVQKELWWTSLWPSGDQCLMTFLRGYHWDQHWPIYLSVPWTLGLRIP